MGHSWGEETTSEGQFIGWVRCFLCTATPTSLSQSASSFHPSVFSDPHPSRLLEAFLTSSTMGSVFTKVRVRLEEALQEDKNETTLFSACSALQWSYCLH